MNVHCECPASGWCARHQMHKGPEQHKRCRGVSGTPDCGLAYWVAWENGRLGATAPANPVLAPDNFCSRAVTKSSIGTVLAEIIRREIGRDIECEQCKEEIASLDMKDQSEAALVKSTVVGGIVSRASQHANFWERIQIAADATLGTGILESRVSAWFDEAVSKGAEPVVAPVKKKARQGALRAAGRARIQHLPGQQRLCELALAESKPNPDPWLSCPVFHLGVHLWPTEIKGERSWLWHVERWNELAEMITGKAIACIAFGPGTVDPEYVKSLFSDRFQIVELQNNADGENQSFRKLQELIPRGNDDVLLYAHGKGVRSHTYASEAVRLWSELMYETVVFNHAGIAQRMSEGYKTFGSFRTFSDMPLDVRNKWHYSGTFFAVRAKHLDYPVKDGYGGVETWPGESFRAGECWNEFADNRPLKAQYELTYMYPRVVDDGMQWEVDRLGGPRCEQHARELSWLFGFMRLRDKVLVIGSKHGGLEYQMQRFSPYIQSVACDIAPQADNTERVIVGDSSCREVQEKIRECGPYDVVFIDGDHSLKGVTADWEFAKTLNPRIIAFHDIAVAVKHRSEGCEVDKLWAEIRLTHNTEEKIVGCGWGGIGVVKCE